MRLISALACTLLASIPAVAAERPNIVFIMTDDHAAHAIGAYGSRVNQTPQPRSPGARGRAADERLRDQLDLHAEPRRDPHRPVLAPQRRDDVQPLRQLAHDGGAAAAAGGYYTGHDRQVAPRQRSRRLRSLGDPAGPGRLHGSGASTRRPARRPTPGGTSPTSSPICAIDFIEKRPRNKPFFLMMHHKAPHRPWEPDARARRAVRRPSGFPNR